jgi:hypothetical protein
MCGKLWRRKSRIRRSTEPVSARYSRERDNAGRISVEVDGMAISMAMTPRRSRATLPQCACQDRRKRAAEQRAPDQREREHAAVAIPSRMEAFFIEDPVASRVSVCFREPSAR